MVAANHCIAKTLTRPDEFRGSMRSLLVIIATGALALIVSGTSSKALDLSQIPVDQPVEVAPVIDPDKCDVTQEMTQKWIADNPLTAALSEAYKNIDKTFDNIKDDQFGHEKSKDITSAKHDAKEMIGRHRSELWRMAERIVGNRIPACDTCKSLNNWGKIKYLTKIGTVKNFGKKDIGTLTRFQMDEPKVIKEIDDLMALRDLVVLPYLPAEVTNAERSASDKKCGEEVTLKIDKLSMVDPKKCNKTFIDKLIATQEQTLGKALDASLAARTSEQKNDDKDMSKLTSIECLPGTSYGYLGFAKLP